MREIYVCCVCQKEFESDCTDEEAFARMKEKFGDFSKEECGIVCDSCYQAFMKWFKNKENKH